MQGDAIRDIRGTFSPGQGRYATRTVDGVFQDLGLDNSSESTDRSYGISYAFYASRVVPAANENRPVNVAVNYLIKAY